MRTIDVVRGFLAVLFLAAGVSAQAAPQGSRGPQLFDASPGALFAADRGVTRARNVAPAFGALHPVIAALRARPDVPVVVAADLFADTPLDLRFDRAELLGDGTEALIGGVVGDLRGSVVLVFKDGILSANIVAHGRTFQVRSRGYSVHEAREVDTTQFVESAADMVAPPPPSKVLRTSVDAGLMTDDGTTIDVMVLYTAAARTTAGSTAAMESLVNLGITETNAAYASSGVIQRVRLVYTGEIAFTETGNYNTDLPAFRANVEAQGLRDTFGADVMSLWMENLGLACGVGYFQDPISNAFAPNAYNLVARSCATGLYSFGHEMGHNMGLRHDMYQDAVDNNGVAGTTPFAYAHGYVDLTNRFRTIMAYNTQCANTPPNISCPRLPYFSNPAVNYVTFPTGDVATANAASALNQSAFTVANFRQTIPNPGVVGFSPAAYSVNEASGSITLFATRSVGTLGAVSVMYATANGTATAGSDFTTTTGTLSWANGESGTKSFSVPVLNDGVNEGNETFTVTLANPTGGVIITAPVATVLLLEAQPDVFPRNCAMPVGWVTPGGATTGWSVSNTDSTVEGQCSLRSNPISDSASGFNTAQIEFTGTFQNGNITFSRRTSTELGYDCLRFTVDGAQKSLNGTCTGSGGTGASGELPWAAVSVPVTAGPHTVRWSYERDFIEGGGSNATWIDNVVLPLAASLTTLGSSANPSNGGQNVTFTATVSGSAGTVAGTVLFKAGGATIAGCGAVAVVAGSAQCSTAVLSNGPHSITAEYSGSNLYNYSVSTPLTQTVNTLTLTSVVSRKTHGAAGALDLVIDPAPLVTGLVSVDPRVGSPGHTLVFTFSTAVSAPGTAAPTDQAGSPIGSASTSASGNSVIVSLSGIADAKRVKVTLTGVNGSGTGYSASTGFLVADANLSLGVDATDRDAIKGQAGLGADATTARYDLNASGAITASDILIAKGRIGNSI